MEKIITSLAVIYVAGVIATAMLFASECLGIYTKKRKKNRRHKNNINILFSLSIYILQINKSHKKLKEVRKIKEEEIINKINKIMHELEDVDFMEINKRKYNQAQVNEAYIMLDELKRELEGTYE